MHTPAVRDWSASTLAERLDHLRETRQAPTEDEKPTQNAFARQLGMEGATYTRLRQRGEGERFSGEVATLYKIATKTGVSFAWLATGEGQPEGATVAPAAATVYAVRPTDDPWPNRTLAIKIALDGGIHRLAVEWLLSEQAPAGHDPPTLWWVERLQLKSLQVALADENNAHNDLVSQPASAVARRRR